MEHLCFISPVERPRIDPDRIEELCEDIGPYATEDRVCRAMEEIARFLCQIDNFGFPPIPDLLAPILTDLVRCAEDIGLTTLARIGKDALICLQDHDGVAVAAVLARLSRNGERSLAALWDLQGASV